MPISPVQEAILQYLQLTHYSSSSDLLCCSALARAMASVEVTLLSLRLQWSMNTLELDPH